MLVITCTRPGIKEHQVFAVLGLDRYLPDTFPWETGGMDIIIGETSRNKGVQDLVEIDLLSTLPFPDDFGDKSFLNKVIISTNELSLIMEVIE